MDNKFELPRPSAGRGHRRLWCTFLWVTLVVSCGVLAYEGLSAYSRSRNAKRVEEASRCPGLSARTGAGYSLARPGGVYGDQCLGWTVTEDYAFSGANPVMRALDHTIVTANQQVAASGKPYVRIGLMMPMTWQEGGDLSETEIVDALRGAAAAQYVANYTSNLASPSPQIQIVLANEGTDQSGWRDPGPISGHARWPGVVPLLGQLAAETAHPLEAVTGMGISLPGTAEAAGALAKMGVPSVGSVLTSTDMVADSFFKVSPSNRQYVEALDHWLTQAVKAGHPFGTALLVFDRNEHDSYVRTLRTAFEQVFGRYRLDVHRSGFSGSTPPVIGTPQLFTSVVDDICNNKPEAAARPGPKLIFYAGRDRDLLPFVQELQTRGRCQTPEQPVVIATGATGLTLTDAQADRAMVGLVDASCTDPHGWVSGRNQAPGGFRALAAAAKAMNFPSAALLDGYAVMHYDGVAAAAWAARTAVADAGTAGNRMPTGIDVRNALYGLSSRRIPGASGSVYFVEAPTAGGLWPINKPIPIMTVGRIAKELPAGKLYYTGAENEPDRPGT